MTENRRWHKNWIKELVHLREQRLGGFPVKKVPKIGERSDDPNSIQKECEEYAPLVEQGEAVAGLVVPSSPHVVTDQINPRHVSFWWWHKKAQNQRSDFGSLAEKSSKEQKDFAAVIAKQAKEAIQRVKGKGYLNLNGMWGFSSKDERQDEGLGKGAPSVDLGHGHVVAITESDAGQEVDDLTAKEKYKFISPWNELLMIRCGNALGEVFTAVLNQNLGIESKVEVRRNWDDVESRISRDQFCWVLRFDEAIGYSTMFEGLIGIAGKFEEIYQQMKIYHANYHKGLNPGDNQIVEMLKGIGIENDKAIIITQRLTSFTQGIRPTYAQLFKWSFEDIPNIERIQRDMKIYEKARGILLAKYNGKPEDIDNVLDLMQWDTIRQRSDPEMDSNWSLRSSAIWQVPEAFITEDDKTTGLVIYPSCASHKSAEMFLGTILRRN